MCRSNREMKPTVGVIDQHDAHPGSEEHEDPSRDRPIGAQHEKNQVFSDQRKIRADAHSDKSDHRHAPEKVAAELFEWLSRRLRADTATEVSGAVSWQADSRNRS